MATPAPEPEEVPDPRRWRILGVSLVIGFMSLLDVTIVNVAVPSMRAGLETTNATVQWVVSGYALAFGLTLVAGGRLGDAYGRRRLMLIGLVGFVASSAAVGLAPSAGLVVAARLVQGATAGLLTPQNTGLIQEFFTGAERGRAFGWFGLTVSVASASGPLLGGAIIAAAGTEDGWRWLFLINVPIGLVALLAILRWVPGSRQARPADGARPTEGARPAEGEGPRIDVPGALLLGAAVLCVLLPVVSLESGARRPLLLLVLAGPFLLAFVRWERRTIARGNPPLLDIGLLRRVPGYAGGLTVGTLYFTGFTGIFLVLSVHLQEDLAQTALMTGLLLTPFAVGSGITSPIAGRLVSRTGRLTTVVGIVVMMLGIVLVAVLTPGRDPEDLWWALAPALLLAGLGGGAVISPNFTLTLAEVPPAMGGAAGGALQTGQRIGSALGAALLMTVYQLADLRWALVAALVLLSLALVASVGSQRAFAAAE